VAAAAAPPSAGAPAAAPAPQLHERRATPEEIAKRFDAAVLKAIQDAGASGIGFTEIRTLVPRLEGQTDDQHRGSIANALRRARLKGHAIEMDHGARWLAP